MKSHLGTVFVSYSHVDTSIAQRIIDELKAARIPTWIDQVQIEPGDSFVEKISNALQDASYLLLLLSPASLASKWVRREWMATLAAENTVLIPIIVQPCDPPAIIRDLQYVDLTSDFRAGVRRLVSFLKAEFSTVGLGKRSFPTSASKVSSLTRRNIRLIARECMSETDLNDFLFDASIDPGAIGGGSLHDRLISLLHYAHREDLIEHFAAWIAIERARCFEAAVTKLKTQPHWPAEKR